MDNLKKTPTIYLAPMEGVVDVHVRQLLTEIGGIDACVSEFIRVTDHHLPRKVFTKICPEINTNYKTNSQVPVYIQLLGGNPTSMSYAAKKLVDMGVKKIDLNFGCPAKTVNKGKVGAFLLNYPQKLYDIASSVVNAVDKSVDISAKIRLGVDSKDAYLDNAIALESAGIKQLFVHARTKSDGYRPPAYWPYVGEIRKKLSIDVVANGEIWSIKDFNRCYEETGCDQFMIGRGLLATPDLALQIKTYCGKQSYQPMSWYNCLCLLNAHYLIIKKHYHGRYIGNRIKQWANYLRLGYTQADQFFTQLKQLKTQEELDLFFSRELDRSK